MPENRQIGTLAPDKKEASNSGMEDWFVKVSVELGA